MAISLNIRGTNYSFPSQGDSAPWGTAATTLIQELTENAHQFGTREIVVRADGAGDYTSFAAAISSITTASATTRFIITCPDSATYSITSNLSAKEYVDIFAPHAKWEVTDATIFINSNCNIVLGDIERISGSSVCIRNNSGTGIGSFNILDTAIDNGSGDFIQDINAGGLMYYNIRSMYISGGGTFYNSNTSGADHAHINVGDLYLNSDSCTGIKRQSGTGSIVAYIDHIVDTGFTGTTAIDLNAGSMSITCNSILADVAFDIAASATLNLQCVDVTGTETVAGTVNRSLSTSNLDDTPADDTETAVTSKWIYDNLFTNTKFKSSVVIDTSDTTSNRYIIPASGGYNAYILDNINVTSTTVFELPYSGALQTGQHGFEVIIINDNPTHDLYVQASQSAGAVDRIYHGDNALNSIRIPNVNTGVHLRWTKAGGWFVVSVIGAGTVSSTTVGGAYGLYADVVQALVPDALHGTPDDDTKTAVTSKWIYDNLTNSGTVKAIPDLQFETENSSFTAEAGKIHYVTTGLSIRTVSAPSSPSANDEIWFIKTDSGSGKILINFAINGSSGFDIEKQYCGIKIKYTGSMWFIVGTIGDCEIGYVNSALEMIYSKTFTGTTDNDSSTSFSTGLPTGYKIVSVGGGVVRNADSIMFFYDSRAGASSANQFNLYDNGSGTFTIDEVGNAMRQSTYRITIKYYI